MQMSDTYMQLEGHVWRLQIGGRRYRYQATTLHTTDADHRNSIKTKNSDGTERSAVMHEPGESLKHVK